MGDVRDALKRLTPFAFDGDFRLKDSHAILDSSKSLRDLELHCGVGEYLELEYDHPNHDAVATGRYWLLGLDDAGFQDLPRPVLRVFRDLESVCHEKARQWVPTLVRKAKVALAYLDARDGGADPSAAEAAAQAAAAALPQSNRQKARNSRVETSDEENLRLLKRALAEGLRRKEPKADGTAKAQGWGENLSRPERREALRKLGRSSPEILKELACLQMCKRAFGTALRPGFGPKLREAAFSVLEELDAAAANALVRLPAELPSESAPAVASKLPASKKRKVMGAANYNAA